MGLDQWAYAVKGEERKEIYYWRKHPDLEGWAATLWHANLVTLNQIEDAINVV